MSRGLFQMVCRAGILAVCGCGDEATRPLPVASIRVAPATVELLVEETFQLAAAVRDVNGRPLEDRPVRWSTSDSTIAIVSAGGLLRGVGIGVDTVTATSEGLSGIGVVTVTPIVVTTVLVNPEIDSLVPGDTIRLWATVGDQKGRGVEDRDIVWSSTNPPVATVSDSGLVQALGPGAALIIASVEGRSDTALIFVSQPVAVVEISPASLGLGPGETAQLSAVARDSLGEEIRGGTFVWASNAPSIVSVTEEGRIYAAQEGSAAVTARLGGKVGTALITVSRQAIAGVWDWVGQLGSCADTGAFVLSQEGSTVTGWLHSAGHCPFASSLNADGTARDTVTGWVARGTVSLHGGFQLVCAFTASVPAGVLDSLSGPVACPGIGSGDEAGATGTWQATRARAVAVVTVTPADTTLPLYTGAPLKGDIRDAAGNRLFGRAFTWGSEDRRVAEVNGGSYNAWVVGLAIGTTTVRGTVGDGAAVHVATSRIAVVSPVARIEITPAIDTIAVGEKAQFTAVSYDSAGNALNGVTTYWASRNPSAATVSPAGVVTGVAPGATSVQAWVSGETGIGTAQVFVSGLPLSVAGQWRSP